MVGGFDFWGEGPLVGAKFPAGAAHGWWEGGKVLAALSLLRRDAPYFLFWLCTTFSTSLCVQPSKQLVLLARSFPQH